MKHPDREGYDPSRKDHEEYLDLDNDLLDNRHILAYTLIDPQLEELFQNVNRK